MIKNIKENKMANRLSIYENTEFEKKLIAIYDRCLDSWPLDHKSLFLETSYGKVHVIASGPENALPILLFHASEMAAWSWLPNIAVLSKKYRTYAVDHIGEAGKSVLKDIDVFPKDGEALSDLYLEISNKLEVRRSVIIGASNGGYIALNYAFYAPERVEKLVLLCPMGLSPPRAIMGIRMVMSQLLPNKRRLMRTVNWALGDNPAVRNFSGEWFLTMMEGVIPRVALPRAVKPVHLQSIEAPVLLFLGTKDNVVGSSKKAERRAAKMEDIKIEILDTGHVPGIEKADVVNSHIIKFLND